MNRHHYGLFVHKCRLVLLLRRAPSDSGDDPQTSRSSDVLGPAEWRWNLPEVCDGHWHHYVVSVDHTRQQARLLHLSTLTTTSPAQRAASQSPHWLQWDPHNLPQNCPFPFDDYHTHTTHPSLDQPHSLSKMASGSIQPFCHSILSGQTDQLTHTHTDQQMG